MTIKLPKFIKLDPYNGYILLHITMLHELYLFSFDCAGSLLLHGLFSSCSVQASHCSGVSRCGARALGRTDFSSCGSQALGHRLSSCGAWASLLRGMWDLPRLGIKPMSPALAGEFFDAETPEKLR